MKNSRNSKDANDIQFNLFFAHTISSNTHLSSPVLPLSSFVSSETKMEYINYLSPCHNTRFAFTFNNDTTKHCEIYLVCLYTKLV